MKTWRVPVAPSDCAVVIAFPLSRASYLSDLAEDSGRDFVRVSGFSTDDWPAYATDVAQPALELVAVARRLGTLVAPEASSGDLRQALAAKPVVVLFAHYRGARVHASDLPQPHRLAEALASAAGCELSAETPTLVARLNALIGRDGSGVQAPAAQRCQLIDSPEEQRRCLQRELLEETFPGLVVNGNTVELRDGLLRPEAIAEMLPPDFDGVLELAVCHSVLVGEAMRRCRRGGAFIVNQEPAVIRFRLKLCREVLRLLAARPQPYLDAVLDLKAKLVKPRR